MTNDRIVEFQRAALVAQQNHLDAALLKLRTAQAEIDLQTEHNRTLFALLLQRDRTIEAMRAEMLAVRGILGEELR
ncbi:MAG: hypothetical protein RJA36_2532 [Pseudomonadota bacterium]|jgi:hypothetical protein